MALHVPQKQANASVQLVGKDSTAIDLAVLRNMECSAVKNALVRMELLAIHKMVSVCKENITIFIFSKLYFNA